MTSHALVIALPGVGLVEQHRVGGIDGHVVDGQQHRRFGRSERMGGYFHLPVTAEGQPHPGRPGADLPNSVLQQSVGLREITEVAEVGR